MITGFTNGELLNRPAEDTPDMDLISPLIQGHWRVGTFALSGHAPLW